MKISNTSERLKEYMQTYGIKQADILKKCEPLCKEYSVKLNKSDLSQYVSGKVEPKQDKLFVIAKALLVNESWLMGLDVPMRPKTDQEIARDNGEVLGKLILDDKTIQMVKDFYDLPKEKQEYVYRTIEMLKGTK